MKHRLRFTLLLAAAAALPGCGSVAGFFGGKGKAMESPEWKMLEAAEARGIVSVPYRAGRRVTVSRNGIVATSHQLASLAGLDMLRSGGNAMDAAIAAAAAIGVVEPMMTGMGGDAFILYYEANTGKVYGLNGSGRSPKALTREHFEKKEKKEIDGNSWEAVTVPGAVDAWTAALARFGTKPLPEVLAPAIRYAEEGFPIAEIVARAWKPSEKKLARDAAARSTYLVNDKAPAQGEVFKSPNMAKTLRTLAAGGRDAFYKGPIAAEIVRYAKETGGFLALEDFTEHKSEWVEPISTNYKGFDVYQIPPNGQGIGVLMMLNIVEGIDLKAMGFNTPEYLHTLIEAKKLAYADLARYVADQSKSKVPVAGMLDKQYAAERRKLIDPRRAAPDVEPGLPAGSDTICFSTIDKDGNAVSFINSLYAAFGSGIVGGETGLLLQNRGEGFTLEPGHPNEYAPGKRPYHTIIPGMVAKDGKLYMAYGLMGGNMQPQGHVQFLLAHLEFGLNIQEAMDFPRWRHDSGLRVLMEIGTPRETMRALQKLGHAITPDLGGAMGGAQAILVDPATGTYFGASDPRKDGAALGY